MKCYLKPLGDNLILEIKLKPRKSDIVLPDENKTQGQELDTIKVFSIGEGVTKLKEKEEVLINTRLIHDVAEAKERAIFPYKDKDNPKDTFYLRVIEDEVLGVYKYKK